MRHVLQLQDCPQGLRTRWVRVLDPLVQRRLGVRRPIVISWISPAAMRRLNNRYRGKDYPTDVLSFAYGEMKPRLPAEDRHEDEIVLCLSEVRKKAREEGQTVLQRFKLLTIHGIMHIRGYDHEKVADARVMEKREKKIFDELEKILAK